MAAGDQYMRGLGAGGQTMNAGYQTGIQGLSNVASNQTAIYGHNQERAGAMFGGMMGLGGAAMGLIPSDRRLKQDIVFHRYDQSLDLNFYKFSYKTDPSRTFIGFMADEVEKKYPNAVYEEDGFQLVDYTVLNSRMVEITEEVA